MATKEDESQVLGAFWAAGFYHVTARCRLALFETYEQFIPLILIFFWIAVNRRY
jgi:hypothetical protein